MRNPKFNLWRPVIDADRKGCSFDATVTEHWQLGQGTRELAQSFLGTLGIDAQAETWSLAPFCTPFYSDEPDADHWGFRNQMAWRVHVGFAAAYWQPRVPFRPLPYGTTEQDPTGKNKLEGDFWVYHQRRAVVIAGFADLEEAAIADRLGAAQALILEITPQLREARIDLGELKFPDEEPKIKAAVEACRKAGGLMHWRDLTVHADEG